MFAQSVAKRRVMNILTHSAKLPTGLYILPMFVLSFFIFNGRLLSPCSSEPNGPIFTKISGLIDGCKSFFNTLSFLISQATLRWQPTKVEKSAFFPDQSTLSLYHSETERNNALYMQNLKRR